MAVENRSHEIMASFSKLDEQWRNGGKASFVQVSISMLGNDCDKLKHVILNSFYSRREEEELESNVELLELLVMATQVGRRGGLYEAIQQ